MESRAPNVRWMWRLLSKSLNTTQLQATCDQASDDFYLEEDFCSGLFLGYYSVQGLKTALEKYGIFDKFQATGLWPLEISVDTKDPFHHQMYVYLPPKNDGNHRLIELKTRLIEVDQVTLRNFITPPRDFLEIEWLAMQNPTEKFTATKPKLPGQRFPGLGISRDVFELLLLMSMRLKTYGLAVRPQWLHNAILYHSTNFRFINPISEGKLRALMRDLVPHFALSQIAWAMEKEGVEITVRLGSDFDLESDFEEALKLDRSDPPSPNLTKADPLEPAAPENAYYHSKYFWEGGLQLCGTGKWAAQYFGDPIYRKFVKKASEIYSFSLDPSKIEPSIGPA